MTRKKKIACIDCGLLYKDFGGDLVMPKSQWLQINLSNNGILCANCMVKRACKIKGSSCVHAIIEIFNQ